MSVTSYLSYPSYCHDTVNIMGFQISSVSSRTNTMFVQAWNVGRRVNVNRISGSTIPLSFAVNDNATYLQPEQKHNFNVDDHLKKTHTVDISLLITAMKNA